MEGTGAALLRVPFSSSLVGALSNESTATAVCWRMLAAFPQQTGGPSRLYLRLW